MAENNTKETKVKKETKVEDSKSKTSTTKAKTTEDKKVTKSSTTSKATEAKSKTSESNLKKEKTKEDKLHIKHILAGHARGDDHFEKTQKAKASHIDEHGSHKELSKVQQQIQDAKKADNDLKNELLGQAVEVDTKGKEEIKRTKPLLSGFAFLFRAFLTQWKTLLTVIIIFLTIVFVLSTLTFFVQKTTEAGFHVPPTDKGEGDFDFVYLTFGQSIWWVFITISTVGFGDIYPLSSAMRAWAIFIGMIGIIFVSLFTAVVVNGFAVELQKNIENRKKRLNEQKGNRDAKLIVKRMQIHMDEKDLEIEELKWALAKLSDETIESIEEAMDHAREHALEYSIEKAKYKKRAKTREANLKKINKKLSKTSTTMKKTK